MKTRITQADGSSHEVDLSDPLASFNEQAKRFGKPDTSYIAEIEKYFQCKWDEVTQSFKKV